MTAEQILVVVLVAACCAALAWFVRRDRDRAFELGWKHGRLWERHVERARKSSLLELEAQIVERGKAAN